MDKRDYKNEKAWVRQEIFDLTEAIGKSKDNLLPAGEVWVGGHDARVSADMLEDWQDEVKILWASLGEIEQTEQADNPVYDPSVLLDYNPAQT